MKVKLKQALAGGVLFFVGLSLLHGSPSRPDQAVTSQNAEKLKQIALFEGHHQPVMGLAFNPDGKILASAGIDHTVRLWDIDSRKQAALLEGHSKQAVAVGFSADGRTLYSAGYDRSIRAWDVKTAKSLALKAGDPAKPNGIPDVVNLVLAFSPDASILAYAGEGAGLFLWEPASAEGRALDLSKNSGLAFAPDGKILAAASAEKQGGKMIPVLHLWNLKTGKVDSTLAGESGDYWNIAWAPDGAQIAVINADEDSGKYAVDVWAVQTGKKLLRLPGQTTYPSGLQFSLDGSTLATCSRDAVRLWEMKTGKELASLATSNAKGGFSALCMSRDGAALAAANLNGTIQVWKLP